MSTHIQRTGRYVSGSEVLLVSPEYLDALIPSVAEFVLRFVWSVAIPVGMMNGLLLIPFWHPLRAAVTAGAFVVAMPTFAVWWRLSRKRLKFLKSQSN